MTNTRKKAMSLIEKMNAILQEQVGNQVGIYDDTFNLNCVGDTFQSLNVPTILFEAGHYPNDYNREQTREFMFQSLLIALNCIALNDIDENQYSAYLEIPKNEKFFYDIIIRNTNDKDIAIQYQEVLIDNSIKFVPKIEKISDLKHFFGHKEIDAKDIRCLESIILL